ncbi:hypothetical protein Dimus_028187 [Dionaea muscipula]
MEKIACLDITVDDIRGMKMISHNSIRNILIDKEKFTVVASFHTGALLLLPSHLLVCLDYKYQLSANSETLLLQLLLIAGDDELIYGYAKIDRLGEIEEFILMPNVANFQSVGDRLYDKALYEAAKIIFAFISNWAKLAITLPVKGNTDSQLSTLLIQNESTTCIIVTRMNPRKRKATTLSVWMMTQGHLMEKIATGKSLHRAFSVFLFNSKYELLLQQRSSKKVTLHAVATHSSVNRSSLSRML